MMDLEQKSLSTQCVSAYIVIMNWSFLVVRTQDLEISVCHHVFILQHVYVGYYKQYDTVKEPLQSRYMLASSFTIMAISCKMSYLCIGIGVKACLIACLPCSLHPPLFVLMQTWSLVYFRRHHLRDFFFFFHYSRVVWCSDSLCIAKIRAFCKITVWKGLCSLNSLFSLLAKSHIIAITSDNFWL